LEAWEENKINKMLSKPRENYFRMLSTKRFHKIFMYKIQQMRKENA